MLRVENNLKKMAYLVFALRFFFNVSGFLEEADIGGYGGVLLSGGLLPLAT